MSFWARHMFCANLSVYRRLNSRYVWVPMLPSMNNPERRAAVDKREFITGIRTLQCGKRPRWAGKRRQHLRRRRRNDPGRDRLRCC